MPACVPYPPSMGKFYAWFRSDGDTRDSLWLRWPDGFVYPECSHARAWELEDGRYGRHERAAVTAGTLSLTAGSGALRVNRPRLAPARATGGWAPTKRTLAP